MRIAMFALSALLAASAFVPALADHRVLTSHKSPGRNEMAAQPPDPCLKYHARKARARCRASLGPVGGDRNAPLAIVGKGESKPYVRSQFGDGSVHFNATAPGDAGGKPR